MLLPRPVNSLLTEATIRPPPALCGWSHDWWAKRCGRQTTTLRPPCAGESAMIGGAGFHRASHRRPAARDKARRSAPVGCGLGTYRWVTRLGLDRGVVVGALWWGRCVSRQIRAPPAPGGWWPAFATRKVGRVVACLRHAKGRAAFGSRGLAQSLLATTRLRRSLLPGYREFVASLS